MSEILIGEVVKMIVDERMKRDLKESSYKFLPRIKEAYFKQLSSKGPCKNVLFIPKTENLKILEEIDDDAKLMFKFLGFSFTEFEYEKFKSLYREEVEVILKKLNPGAADGFIISVPSYVEGSEKTSAQEMWEQLIKEYQEQVHKDENEAEKNCKEFLEKLKNGDYKIKSYPLKSIVIKVEIKNTQGFSEKYAWREKVKKIMCENGFDFNICKLCFKTDEWIINYKMAK